VAIDGQAERRAKDQPLLGSYLLRTVVGHRGAVRTRQGSHFHVMEPPPEIEKP